MHSWPAGPSLQLGCADLISQSPGCTCSTSNYCGCCCSVTKSCPTVCSPMDCGTQASLSITNSHLLKLMSIESVMPSNHLILCRPLLLLPFIFPSIRVFSNESPLCIRWPKYWSFSFSLDASNDIRVISFNIDFFDLLAV